MTHDRPSEDSIPAPTGRVLLIGWDAADWKIITSMLDRGEMPHLQRLIARGVMGDLLTLRPVISPMLWNSIATGRRPEDHGVHGFTEVDPTTNTVRSVSSTTRRCKALWNIVTQARGRAHVVNWYASHPAEPIRGISVSDTIVHSIGPHPAPEGTVHPAALREDFSAFRMRPDEMSWDMLKLFVPHIAEVDQEKDHRLVQLAKMMAESFTVHNAATRVVTDEPWNLLAVYYPGIDHFCHGFINFHPPQLPGIPDDQFRLYSNVVNGAYRLHDLLLGRMIDLAGPDTTVVLLSDHGFHSDHLRPRSIPAEPVGPAVQHRPHGILVMAGAGLKQNERVYGAGLLDVTPTVLSLLGLPVGRDMPGRALIDAFVEPPATGSIPSWEQVPGDAGQHPPGFVAPSQDQSLVLEQFAALGYLDLNEMQGAIGPDACRRENDWSLAQSLMHSQSFGRAIDVLVALCQRWPERGDFALVLAEALRQCGHAAAASELVESLVARNPDSPAAHYLLGVAALEEKHHAKAIEHLRAAASHYRLRADWHHQLGQAYMRLGDRAQAEAAFTRAVNLDPHDSNGWLGLTRCAVRNRDWPLAEERALQTIALNFHRPVAHALLGLARVKLGRNDEGLLALRVASLQAPQWGYPRRLRASLLPLSHAEREMHDRAPGALAPSQRARRREPLAAHRRAALDQLIDTYRQVTTVDKPATPAPASPAEKLDLVVVSGLPRSGTSLMMQMLQAAGLPGMTDGKRAADEDNPEGYLEWEEIKNLPHRPDLLTQAQGKAVKVISPLLSSLPSTHQYNVIFLDRPIDEILASQARMRQRRGAADAPDLARLRAAMLTHRNATLAMLKQAPNVRAIVVPYPALVADSHVWSARIAAFLQHRLPNPDRLSSAIRTELYRNRSNAAPAETIEPTESSPLFSQEVKS